jgi:hypothetical protein
MLLFHLNKPLGKLLLSFFEHAPGLDQHALHCAVSSKGRISRRIAASVSTMVSISNDIVEGDKWKILR